MNERAPFEIYLRELRRGLRFYPGKREDVLDEVRDHLLEAKERARLEGDSEAEAEARAERAFGKPRRLGRRFVAQRSRARARLLLPAAFAAGLALAYVDSRPNWDDTGVSALAVLITAGLCALIEPSRAWVWALCVGAFIPLHALWTQGDPAACLALALAGVGAFGGRLLRRLAAPNAQAPRESAPLR